MITCIWGKLPSLYQQGRWGTIFVQAMVTEGNIDIKISEMKINSHIIPLDNMATVAILTLGEMVERQNNFHRLLTLPS